MLLKKQILAPGTYWVEGLDGQPTPFIVTAEDIRHYQAVGQSMVRSGLHIPVPIEHGDAKSPPGPMSAAQKAADVALNNAGWMRGYQVQDGSLWGLLDIEDEETARKAKTTIKYVSPYISPSFVNPNTGEKLHNLISHVALTPQPLFTRQTPFGASLSARSLTRPVALSMGNRIQLSGGAMPFPPKKDDADKAKSEDVIVNDKDPETETEEPSPVDPAAPVEEPAENAHAVTSKLAAILAEDGIVVEPCDDPMEFLRHALTAYASHRGTKEALKKEDDDANGQANPAGTGAGTPAPEPQYTAMSARAKKAEALNVKLSAELANRYAAELLADIDFLGRVDLFDADEAKAAKQLVGAKKLSLASSPATEILELKATIKALKKQAAKNGLGDGSTLTQHLTATQLSAARPVGGRPAHDPATEDEAKAKEAGQLMASMASTAPPKKK